MYAVADWGSRKEPGGCSAFPLSDNQYWADCWGGWTTWTAGHITCQKLSTSDAANKSMHCTCKCSVRAAVDFPLYKSSTALVHELTPLLSLESFLARQGMWYRPGHNKRMLGRRLHPLMLMQSCLNGLIRCHLWYLEWEAFDTFYSQFLKQRATDVIYDNWVLVFCTVYGWFSTTRP